MDMKNAVILLIFLLSILGLIIGVHYTADDTADASQNSDDIGLKSENNSIILHLQKKENDSSLIDRILNLANAK